MHQIHNHNIYRPEPCRHYNQEDAHRDLPQSLLLPHSLDITVPGRQVLLRHQKVLHAPPKTPPPTALPKVSFCELCSPSARNMPPAGGKLWKHRWRDFKRRVSPHSFPHAWFLFLIIIMIAAGAVVTGWYGLAVETIRHHAKPFIVSSAAPPDLADVVPVTSTSSVQANSHLGFVAVTVNATNSSNRTTSTVQASPSGQRLREVHSPVPPPSRTTEETITVTDESTTTVTKDLTTTVTNTTTKKIYITVTATSPAPTSSSTSSPGPSPAPSSSTSTSSTASSSTARHMYCPFTGRPNIWTLCAPEPEPTTALAQALNAPSATVSLSDIHTNMTAASSVAAPGITNPLSALRLALASLWGSASSLGRTAREVRNGDGDEYGKCNCDRVCDCEYGKVRDKLQAALDLARMQAQLLDSQDALIREHRRQFAAAMEVLDAVVRNETGRVRRGDGGGMGLKV
ncbi:hypothetical protein F5B20DRAFT_576970 [Whalleya microplaca]|nr:hypothetical protein F5B20DRAFT_576970 [Whalleya microplaca]